MRLAIVGSTKFTDRDAYAKAWDLIGAKLTELQPDAVISGGAEGVDWLASVYAQTMGYSLEAGAAKRLIIHRPNNPRWAPDGYMVRNLLIAEDCTHLLAIRCKQATTYGSGWTADRAAQMGKTVWREYL